MSVRVYTKDVGEVRDVYRRECGFKLMPEDMINKWIKRNMGIDKC